VLLVSHLVGQLLQAQWLVQSLLRGLVNSNNNARVTHPAGIVRQAGNTSTLRIANTSLPMGGGAGCATKQPYHQRTCQNAIAWAGVCSWVPESSQERQPVTCKQDAQCTAPGRCPWSVRQAGSVSATTPLASHLYTRPVHRGGPPRPAVDALRATTSWGLNLCAGSCGGGVVPQPLLGTRLSSVRPSRPPSASDTRKFSRVRPRACSHMQSSSTHVPSCKSAGELYSLVWCQTPLGKELAMLGHRKGLPGCK
jgi:hypothetical protein